MLQKPLLLGITGNIASGKSVVRQYLENAGAFTIDADLLAQQTYLPGNPAYQPILQRFGNELLLGDGQINRSKLGRLVFADAQARKALEDLIYPTLFDWLEALLALKGPPLRVIEAINLFESGLDARCDANWAVTAPHELRLQRLMDERGMGPEQANARIQAQNPQAEKAARASTVISTEGSFLQTYEAVAAALAALALPSALQDSQPGLLAAKPHDAGLWPAESEPDPEARAQTLARQSVHIWSGPDQKHQLNWKLTSRVAMLRQVQPRPSLEQRPPLLAALAKQARSQSALDLVIRADFLSPSLAKSQAFWPGADTPPGLNETFFQNFLRQQGLMAAEAYHLPLE